MNVWIYCDCGSKAYIEDGRTVDGDIVLIHLVFKCENCGKTIKWGFSPD